ncbi:hypothetical protein BMS3Abin16_00400 [archaeon BMS3Abin16]|nr:hypothetical protein BMS3Abin16_00400 [archaeon BMS3Abin16]GBE56166.1 hypothetical protein BMS3Bbin16_00365 [archaeon BMS3Bbin16]
MKGSNLDQHVTIGLLLNKLSEKIIVTSDGIFPEPLQEEGRNTLISMPITVHWAIIPCTYISCGIFSIHD